MLYFVQSTYLFNMRRLIRTQLYLYIRYSVFVGQNIMCLKRDKVLALHLSRVVIRSLSVPLILIPFYLKCCNIRFNIVENLKIQNIRLSMECLTMYNLNFRSFLQKALHYIFIAKDCSPSCHVF